MKLYFAGARGEEPCGECASCIERLEAFKFAYSINPLSYEVRK